MNNPGYLVHYASEYYDPQKAHEYYMQHRKVKGRSSSKSTEDSVGEKASLGSNWSSSSESDSNGSSTFQEEYERYTFETGKKIQALQRRLGRLSKEARLLLGDQIQSEIDDLREQNMNKKYELKAKYGEGGSGSSGGNDGLSASEEAYKAKWNK